MPEMEVENIIQEEDWKKAQEYKLMKKKKCFQCRQSGHVLDDCPQGLKLLICYLVSKCFTYCSSVTQNVPRVKTSNIALP